MASRLSAGDQAPDFDLPDDVGGRVRLSDYRGRRLVVYVYPNAMTPGCTTEACDFRDSLEALKTGGVDVVGLSPDPPEKLARFRERDSLTFALASDPGMDTILAFGAFGERSMYGRVIKGVLRSTFVIDGDGRIEKAMYNVRAKGHVARLRTELGL